MSGFALLDGQVLQSGEESPADGTGAEFMRAF